MSENYRKIYEEYNSGSLIPGIEIHHIDGNHSNNHPENLMAVTIEEHYDIHYQQEDFGACQAIAIRMLENDSISDLARKAQKKRINDGTHNFQKMSSERRTEISKRTHLSRKNGAFIISDPVENSRNAGKAAAAKKAGFLNTNSLNHGSKHVKNTYWWTNINTGKRKRSLHQPGEEWRRGMN